MKAKPNTLYPGRPNYTGPTRGLFFLLHHDRLIEHSRNVVERIKYIQDNKPSNEIETRLWHVCLFPPDKIPAEWDKAYAEWDKAEAEPFRRNSCLPMCGGSKRQASSK